MRKKVVTDFVPGAMAHERQLEGDFRPAIGSPQLPPGCHITLGYDGATGPEATTLEFQTETLSHPSLPHAWLRRRESAPKPKLGLFNDLAIPPMSPEPRQDIYVADSRLHGFNARFLRQPHSHHSAISPILTTPRTIGSTPLLTPPADPISLKWAGTPATPQESSESWLNTLATTKGGSLASNTGNGSLAEHGAGPSADSSLAGTETGGKKTHDEAGRDNRSQLSMESGESGSCLDQSIFAAVMSLDAALPSSRTIQVVSQTLPSPAHETARPNAVFTKVIAEIQSHFGLDQQPYITITHAVPPRFDLLDLPSSPPSTPNIAPGTEDYFTQSIFAHAAVVPSYHLSNNAIATSVPASPNPIVPPSSVQISVLERYIPPSSPQEGKEMFSLSGQSVLVDRLSELSPTNGKMIFVYPTRTGASTFTGKYLSPVIEPLLRALVEVHQLSYGLAESLGSMAAVGELHGFENLKAKVTSFCRLMSHRISSDTQRSNFQLVHSTTAQISMDGRTWTNWYLKQEHPRFKRTLETYWGRGKRLSQVEQATAGTVLREFIDGVTKVTSEDGERLGPEMEVGVFVIQRTLAAAAAAAAASSTN